MLVIVYLCSMQAHINKNKNNISLHYSNYFLFLIDMKKCHNAKTLYENAKGPNKLHYFNVKYHFCNNNPPPPPPQD